MAETAYIIKLTGLVQGVGFRPFVHRLATRHHLHGWVENRNDGVLIKLNGHEQIIKTFCRDLVHLAPGASSIQELSLEKDGEEQFSTFEVRESRDLTDEVTEISPDIAVCEECLEDLEIQPRRIHYPLINCAHCGPRFSIVRDLPYDRSRTTMSEFQMCPECSREYHQIENRRYHAQPVSCNHCGPTYRMEMDGRMITTLDEILSEASSSIGEGKLLAIKGTGGYHLACDAFQPEAVRKLRDIKARCGKPFAVMFRDLDSAMAYVQINRKEEEILTSWRRPILLLRKVQELAEGIADGLSCLGVMLPYMPFHILLFDKLHTPALVMTSGNVSDEPIAVNRTQVERRFAKMLDGIVSYNREIYNRIDDSVTAFAGDNLLILRRARGFAPAPLRTGFDLEGVLGTGAELTGSFCIGKGEHAILSQYTGDLNNIANYNFYTEAYQRFRRLFRFTPRIIVSDLHPDYMSTRFAEQLARDDPAVTHLRIQHHHAHIASVMLDAGVKEEVIGFSFDGTGLGVDGHGWGGEVMRANFNDFERMYHFEYMPLPGGDMAVKEPWRMAVAYLFHHFGSETENLRVPLVETWGKRSIRQVTALIEKGVRVPKVSSAGRLFDAVAAILGLTYHAAYTAHAPMLLESIIDTDEKGSYQLEIRGKEISFRPMIIQLVNDIHQGLPTGRISARFHNTVVSMVVHLSNQIRAKTGLEKVVLAGGTFQNRYLVENASRRLAKCHFEVFIPSSLPVNDQGIAAGQVVLGAFRWRKLQEEGHA